jgi:BMFP domain-containing protein YqiC
MNQQNVDMAEEILAHVNERFAKLEARVEALQQKVKEPDDKSGSGDSD